MKNIIFAVLFFSLALSTSSFSFAQGEQCSVLKVTTLPRDFGSIGTIEFTRQTIQPTEPNTPQPISVFIPNTATAQNKVPVIFFAHGFGGIDYRFYEGMIRQLASNGYAVVFSPYDSGLFSSNHTQRYNQMWSGFTLAVQNYGTVLDTTRVGFAGHSYGAGATAEMTRRGVAQGWGSNGLFIFPMAPWYSFGTNNFSSIPASAKLIVQVYWDDATNEHLIGQNDVWNRLPQITERKWQVLRESKCFCTMKAGHSVTVTNGLGQTDAGLDGYDYWAVWRRIHALATYTFTNNQTAKDIAFGTNADMGKWRNCAYRSILPLESTNSPVLNTNSNASFVWSAKCLYAQGSTCP
jgi:hypothetical protein